MKNIIKLKEIIIYAVLSLAFILLALLGDWDDYAVLSVFSLPFEWLGKGFRLIGNNAFAYILYIILCLLPLIFPAVRIIKTKKLLMRNFIWLAPTAFMLLALYFFINPHKLSFALPDAGTEFQKLSLLGISATFYAILLFCFIWELYFKQKENGKRAYGYAKALFVILIIGVLANAFFIRLIDAKTSVAALPGDGALTGEIDLSTKINRAVNIFVIIFSYLISLVPLFFTLLLFLQAKAFVSRMQTDMFAAANVPELKNIIKTCVITIFTTLGSIILENILCLIFSGVLASIYYQISVPLEMILAACLTLIFSQILIKAIEVNEENKLVI